MSDKGKGPHRSERTAYTPGDMSWLLEEDPDDNIVNLQPYLNSSSGSPGQPPFDYSQYEEYYQQHHPQSTSTHFYRQYEVGASGPPTEFNVPVRRDSMIGSTYGDQPGFRTEHVPSDLDTMMDFDYAAALGQDASEIGTASMSSISAYSPGSDEGYGAAVAEVMPSPRTFVALLDLPLPAYNRMFVGDKPEQPIYSELGCPAMVHHQTRNYLNGMSRMIPRLEWRPQACRVYGTEVLSQETDCQDRAIVQAQIHPKERVVVLGEMVACQYNDPVYRHIGGDMRYLTLSMPFTHLLTRMYESMAMGYFWEKSSVMRTDSFERMITQQNPNVPDVVLLDMMYMRRFSNRDCTECTSDLKVNHFRQYRNFIKIARKLVSGRTSGVGVDELRSGPGMVVPTSTSTSTSSDAGHEELDRPIVWSELSSQDLRRNLMVMYNTLNEDDELNENMDRAVESMSCIVTPQYTVARNKLLQKLMSLPDVFDSDLRLNMLLDLVHPTDGYANKLLAARNPWGLDALVRWMDIIGNQALVAYTDMGLPVGAINIVVGDIYKLLFECIRASLRMSVMDMLSVFSMVHSVDYAQQMYMYSYFLRINKDEDVYQLKKDSEDYIASHIPVGKDLDISLVNPLLRALVRGDDRLIKFMLSWTKINVHNIHKHIFQNNRQLWWLTLLAASHPINQSSVLISQLVCIIYCRTYLELQTYADNDTTIHYGELKMNVGLVLCEEMISSFLGMGMPPTEIKLLLQPIVGDRVHQARDVMDLAMTISKSLSPRCMDFLHSMQVVRDSRSNKCSVQCSISGHRKKSRVRNQA